MNTINKFIAFFVGFSILTGFCGLIAIFMASIMKFFGFAISGTTIAILMLFEMLCLLQLLLWPIIQAFAKIEIKTGVQHEKD